MTDLNYKTCKSCNQNLQTLSFRKNKQRKDGKSLFDGLLEYIQFYNYERKHQALLYLTPNQVFNERLPITKNSAILAKI